MELDFYLLQSHSLRKCFLIVDKLTIQYIIEEAIQSGIEEILIITGRNKRAIEDHFDRSVELELSLEDKGKDDLLDQVRSISNMVNIQYIRPKEPKGLGHAINCAKSFVGNEPFATLLGDDIVDANTPCLKQLIDVYDEYNTTVLGVQEVSYEDVNKYGIVDEKHIEDGVYKVNNLVEKPAKEEVPSNVAILGRCIIIPEIFDILDNINLGAGGEIQLTDGLRELDSRQDMYAYSFEGRRYDVGNKLEFLQVTTEFALKRDDIKDGFKECLVGLLRNDMLKDVYEEVVAGND